MIRLSLVTHEIMALRRLINRNFHDAPLTDQPHLVKLHERICQLQATSQQGDLFDDRRKVPGPE